LKEKEELRLRYIKERQEAEEFLNYIRKLENINDVTEHEAGEYCECSCNGESFMGSGRFECYDYNDNTDTYICNMDCKEEAEYGLEWNDICLQISSNDLFRTNEELLSDENIMHKLEVLKWKIFGNELNKLNLYVNQLKSKPPEAEIDNFVKDLLKEYPSHSRVSGNIYWYIDLKIKRNMDVK
jgi:hypothetical protein